MSWRPFGVFRRFIAEDLGESVVMEEWLLPSEEGPYLINADEKEPTWAVSRTREPK